MGSMFKAEVVALKNNKFAVQLYLCPGSDEMIEVLQHAARIPTKARAEALAAKVNATRKFNPTHWLWSPSKCSPYQFIQQAPTAVAYDVG